MGHEKSREETLIANLVTLRTRRSTPRRVKPDAAWRNIYLINVYLYAHGITCAMCVIVKSIQAIACVAHAVPNTLRYSTVQYPFLQTRKETEQGRETPFRAESERSLLQADARVIRAPQA